MPFVDCGAAILHYQISGTIKGPWLLLSNSLGTDLTMWDRQTEAFGEYFRVLRYDMRGHGASSVPTGPYTIAVLGADIVNLLDRLDIPRVSFCGLSIGGVIGQWLAVNTPQRIEKLVLCNTAARIGTSDVWNNRIESIRSCGMASIADDVLTRWFSPSFTHSSPSEVAAMRRILTTTSPQGYVSSCEAIRDMDQREMIRQIVIHTLIVAGEFDPVTTVDDGLALRDSIRGSQLITVPGAHISNVEAPSYFNTAVLTFLQKAGF